MNQIRISLESVPQKLLLVGTFVAAAVAAIGAGLQAATIVPRVATLERQSVVAHGQRIEIQYMLCEILEVSARDCDPDFEIGGAAP